MNAFIETLNRWGEAAIPLAGQVLWQSSLLIVVLLALDLLLRHRVRAGFRYALWMLLLVKLVLPPSLALPTGAGYWIERPVKTEALVEPPVTEVAVISPPRVDVTAPASPGTIVDPDLLDRALAEAVGTPSGTTITEIPAAPAVRLTLSGRLLAGWLVGTLLLLGWMLWRWRWVKRLVRASEPGPTDLQALLANVYQTACRQHGRDRRSARSDEAHEATDAPETQEAPLYANSPDGALGETRPTISVRLTDADMSPAVCGLLRPVILLPRTLVNQLTGEQLRTVLLHELIHLRRRDLWVNCAQTLMQIAAWWHPLLWVANARIRRVREEAVDEAVACALRDDADAYPATLLEVAKLTFTRPLMTLGLVGILESKNALKQRIRRLLELPPLESTRLKWWQWVAVVAIALTALPMAQGQRRVELGSNAGSALPALSSRVGVNFDPRTDLASGENSTLYDTIIGYEWTTTSVWAVPRPHSVTGAKRLGLTSAGSGIDPAMTNGRRLYAQVEPAASPAMTADVWAVKLDRRAWGWLTRHAETHRVTGQTNAYVHRGASLGEWLDKQEGVEKLKGGRFSLQERQAVVVGDFSPDRRTIEPYSQARIELTSWFDQADPRQVWLKLDGVIDWSGTMAKTQFGLRGEGPEMGSHVVHVTSRGYVNQQFKTDGTSVRPGDWLIIGAPFDRQTIEPIFAVVVQPLLAQGASIDPEGNRLGPVGQPSSDQGSSSPQSPAGNPDTEPPQVAIEVRVVELHQVEDQRALGSDWLVPALWGPVQKLGTVNSDILAITLTDPQFRVAIKALEQRTGVQLKFMPRVITPSGRQVQYKLPGPADLASRDDNLRPTGTSRLLQVIPHVAADGSTIQTRLIYMTGELPDMPEPATREPLSATNPVPLYGVRRIVDQPVTNGQTIVLPFQPLSSSLKPGTNGMQTLIFVTPTIIDPAGNPVVPAIRSPDNHGQITPRTDSSNRVAEFQKSRALAEANLELTKRVLRSKREQLQVDEFWLMDDAVIQHPFVQRHIEVLQLSPPAEFQTARKAYLEARKGRDAIDLQMAQEKINQQLDEQRRQSPSPEAQARTDAVIREQQAAAARDIERLRREHQALKDQLGRDPLEHPEQNLDKAEFLRLLPLVEAAIRLQQAEERHGQIQQLLNERKTAQADGDSEPSTALPTQRSEPGTVLKIKNAQLLIEMGQLNEAEALLREAARDDPANAEIAYHLDRIQQRRATPGSRPARQIVEVVAAQPAGESDSPNSDPERPQVQASPGRHLIMEKLNKTMLSEVKFEQLPLGEVLKELSDEVRRRDPDGTGINFVLVPRIDNEEATEGTASTNALASTVIDIDPALKNLRLIDALNAIVMAADRRIQFTVEDFAVVFTPRPPEKEPLETRQFRVNPNTFYQGLEGVAANMSPPIVLFSTNPPAPPAPAQAPATAGEGVRFLTTTNDMSAINAAARAYFEAVGVDLKAPKALFFNDRKGILLVRATAADFEVIERAVGILNYEPAQIQLEVRAVEVTNDVLWELGFDWFVSPFDPKKSTNVVTGILTDPQFQVVRQAMSQRWGVEFGAEHRVVTLSGRQAQMALTSRLMNGPLQMYLTRPEAMHPNLDLIPYIGPDGVTIQMTVILTLAEFFPTEGVAVFLHPPAQTTNSGTGEQPSAAGTPPPRYRTRQVASTANLRDGQTIVQSYPLHVEVPSPHLAAVPTAGPNEPGKRHLLIFITPTIIDAAGNRVRKPGELPLANELVPPQAPTEP